MVKSVPTDAPVFVPPSKKEHKYTIKTKGRTTTIKRNPKPKVKDYRLEFMFFGKPLWEGWIPNGVVNEILPIYEDATNEKMLGEIQIGSDGFIEAMFYMGDKLVKIKRLPGDKRLFIGSW